MVRKKTPLMQAVEKTHHIVLEHALLKMVNEIGLSATAEKLGVSKPTLSYWLLSRFRIDMRRVVLSPGEILEVHPERAPFPTGHPLATDSQPKPNQGLVWDWNTVRGKMGPAMGGVAILTLYPKKDDKASPQPAT